MLDILKELCENIGLAINVVQFAYYICKLTIYLIKFFKKSRTKKELDLFIKLIKKYKKR